jgi:hypothetical protein
VRRLIRNRDSPEAHDADKHDSQLDHERLPHMT